MNNESMAPTPESGALRANDDGVPLARTENE